MNKIDVVDPTRELFRDLLHRVDSYLAVEAQPKPSSVSTIAS